MLKYLAKTAGFLRNLGTIVKALVVVALLVGGYLIYDKISNWKPPSFPTVDLGTPLVCPSGWTLRGGFCYQDCPAGWTSDGTHGCYQPCPANWPGTETLAHCQHATIYSSVGADPSKSIPSGCPPGKVNKVGLCYNLPDGWDVTAPGFIGKKCPDGWRDDGTSCWDDLVTYGRGAGYALWDEGKCRRENNGSCERHIALWYPTCRPGFEAVGCCICSKGPKITSKEVQSQIGTFPDRCQDGRELHGRFCYPQCSAGYQRPDYNLEFCSTICPAGFTDIGIGGCQKPRRSVEGKMLTEGGVCPPDAPVQKGLLCYKP